MADSSHSCVPVLTTWSTCHNRQRGSHNIATQPSGQMGEYAWNNGYSPGRYTISTSNLDDLAVGTCWKSEHSYDAYTDTRELRLVRQLGRQAWN